MTRKECGNLFLYAGYMGFALSVPFLNYALQVVEGWLIEEDIMAVNITLAVVMVISMKWTTIITNMYGTKDKEKADRIRKIVNNLALITVAILATVLVFRIFPHHKLWGVVNVTTPVLFKLGIKQVIETFTPVEVEKEEEQEQG